MECNVDSHMKYLWLRVKGDKNYRNYSLLCIVFLTHATVI